MKKQFIKVITFCTLVGAFTLSAMAQQAAPPQADKPAAQEKQPIASQRPPLTPEQRTDMRVKALKQRLALTDDQTKKIKALFSEQEKKTQAYMEEMRKRQQMMNDTLAKILTPEQMEKYKQMSQRPGVTNQEGKK